MGSRDSIAAWYWPRRSGEVGDYRRHCPDFPLCCSQVAGAPTSSRLRLETPILRAPNSSLGAPVSRSDPARSCRRWPRTGPSGYRWAVHVAGSGRTGRLQQLTGAGRIHESKQPLTLTGIDPFCSRKRTHRLCCSHKRTQLTGDAGSRTIEDVIPLEDRRLLARANSSVTGGFATAHSETFTNSSVRLPKGFAF